MRYDNIGDVPLDELKHYGVKGMKWGVRRNSGPRPTNELIKTNRKARKEAKATLKTQKKISDLQIKQAKANFKAARETYKNHPAHQTTGYMTTGEKRAVKILGGTLAAGVTVAALGPSAQSALSTMAPSAAKTTASLVSEGMQPGYLANVGESVSVYWR